MAFTYLDSWEDAIAMLPEEQQAEARLAIITYGLKGEIMDGISPTSKAIVMLVKPTIDAEKEESKAPKRGNPNFKKGQKNPYQQVEKDNSEIINDNPKVLYRFVDFHNLLVDTANRRRIMNTTGIKKGDSISSRNCAMTEVAKMLKCRKILADSVPMKIVIGDKEVEGVFMENAEGSDINHLDKGNKLLMAKSSSFESPTTSDAHSTRSFISFSSSPRIIMYRYIILTSIVQKSSSSARQ